jgi:hypothetical protein
MMVRMTRTQISLQEDHYLFVKAEAARQGKSLSAIIRDLIENCMKAHESDGPRLDEIVGFFSGGGLEGMDHDHHLYGWERRSTDTEV